uniref:Uncharacterized protein n=1 Tax=Candidatus Kentrum sp. LFY TaxID=2126342 RepID=A0A450WC06_9GAMM|nr:MAG: hypothetical protein BECKLFY1418C_GA0070996_100934 [Candidatus Kentron sp. LFY]
MKKEIKEKPLCVNCKFAVGEPVIEEDSQRPDMYCTHPHLIEPVKGRARSCYKMRQNHRECGDDGRLFESIEPPPVIPKKPCRIKTQTGHDFEKVEIDCPEFATSLCNVCHGVS